MLDVLTSDPVKKEATSNSPTTAVSDKLGITLVDAGMVAQLNDEESSTFIGILAALGEGDGRAAAEFALRFSIENNMRERERAQFVQEMISLFAEKCRGYGTNVDVGEVLRRVLSLIRIHHVRIDANYATLVVNVLCVESLARRVCPSYNVLDAAKPLLQTYRRHFFESDGFTPKTDPNAYKVWNSAVSTSRLKLICLSKPSNSLLLYSLVRSFFFLRYFQRFKAVTPVMYLKKKRADDLFFKKVSLEHRRRKLSPS